MYTQVRIGTVEKFTDIRKFTLKRGKHKIYVYVE